MVAADSDKPTGQAKRALTLVEPKASTSDPCTTCPSNQWIWDEEIELVRKMNAVKHRVREAHRCGDEAQVLRLREEFSTLRKKMEKIRRTRLDALGHYDYD